MASKHKGQWTDELIFNLLSCNEVPEWWNPDVYFVDYDLLDFLFNNFHRVPGTRDEIISSSLTCLYSSVSVDEFGNKPNSFPSSLPETFKSVQKKLCSRLEKKGFDRFSIFQDFYRDQEGGSDFVGEICQSYNITKTSLQNFLESSVPISLPESFFLSNGFALELYSFQSKSDCWNLSHLLTLFNFFSGESITVDNNHVLCLNKALKKLYDNKRNKRRDKIECKKFLSEKFSFLSSASSSEQVADDPQSVFLKIVEKDNAETKRQLEACREQISCLVEKLTTCEEQLAILSPDAEKSKQLRIENNNLNKKLQKAMKDLSSYSPYNVQRRMERRDKEIDKLELKNSDLKEEVNKLVKKEKILESENTSMNATIEAVNQELERALKAKVRAQNMKSYRKRVSKSQTSIHTFDDEISELKNRISVLEIEKMNVEENLKNFLDSKIITKENGRYTNEVRLVYQDLALSGVSCENINYVVTTVLKNLTKMEVECLPKSTFARYMYLEARNISHAHASEKILESDQNNTLHADGTSKFGQSFETYDVSLSSGEKFVLGLREVGCSTAISQFECLKTVVEDVCQDDSSKAKKIFSSLRNTMSDRHIVQKNFTKILEDYRLSVLPEIISNWSELSEKEKTSLGKINDFFCGLHYIVGLADISETALRSWDKLVHDDKPIGTLKNGGYSIGGESGTVRLVRTLCKAVQTKGCEKSGRMIDFASFLQTKGFDTNPFIPFRGNRFNIVFYNGGVTYYLHEYCREFFKDVYSENKLLTAVHHDLQVSSLIVGTRALGLVNKYVTGPLWRLLETNIHVLDLSRHFQEMETTFSKLAIDSTPILEGKVVLFGGEVEISKDDIFQKLSLPSEFDQSTKQCLEILFGSFAIITRRMLHDHLKGGKYDTMSSNSELRNVTKSVPKTNAVAERDFGMLDRLMREKPNANHIILESIIMNRTNKTSAWRDSLDENKRNKIMNWARKTRGEQYKRFIQQRKAMRKQQEEKRVDKLKLKRDREIKIASERQRLTLLIEEYGGLWVTSDQVTQKLDELDTEKSKREALKAQIQFRQKVLSLPGVDKKLYTMSESGKLKSFETLKANLSTLVSFKAPESVDIEPIVLSSLLISSEKLEAHKSHLKELVDEEVSKISKKSSGQPPSKKKKKSDSKNSQTSDSIPIISCVDELVGKRVEHLTSGFDDAAEEWFSGTVICIHPKVSTDLVIRYDCELNKLYSFSFDDFNNGSVILIPLIPEQVVGKKIQQKFSDEKGNDFWWETGLVIAFNEEKDEYTVNFFEPETSDYENLNGDDDDFLNVYEVCSFPLVDDYLNHDIRFI